MTDSNKPWRDAIRQRLSIGAFIVDPLANELHRDGRAVRVRPLLMDVLLRLAATPGQVVSRDQLLDDVWPRRMVNDEVLSRAIAELRTALADDAKEPRYIETLPKVGYRLIAPVATIEAEAAVTATRATVATAATEATAATAAPMVTTPTITTAPATATATATTPSPDVPANVPLSAPAPLAVNQTRTRSIALATIGAAVIIGLASAILLRTPAGETAERLTVQLAAAQTFSADADLELSPRFSPDGTNVIYAQGTTRETRLVIRDLKGNIVSMIEKPGALLLTPVFGPWSRKIFYWQRTSDGCAIIERDLATSAERQVVGCDNAPQPRFDLSWDGAYLAVSWRPRPQHPFGIARVRVSDGAVEMLTTPQPGEGDDGLPRFSPDASKLVFARGGASHAKLWIMDPSKPSSARALVDVEGLLYGVAWLGKGGPLIAAADWPGFRALHRIDLERGERGSPELIGARGARFPDASTSGDIAYEAATYRADLWLTDSDEPAAATAQALWPSTRYTNQPEFSPDGKRVVFTSNREGAEALFIGTIGGDARKLIGTAEHRFLRAHWSPDGRSLYAVRSPVSARHSGPREGVRIDAADGRIDVLKTLGSEVNDVRELSDGSLLVAESTGNAMRLIRITDGKPARLGVPLVTQLQTWGDDLVFTQSELKTLTRCKLATLQCAPLPVEIGESDLYHWHLGQGVLWYRARPDGGQMKLMKLDLTDGSTRAFDFAPTGTGTGLATTPDGKRLIVTRELPVMIDVMVAKK